MKISTIVLTLVFGVLLSGTVIAGNPTQPPRVLPDAGASALLLMIGVAALGVASRKFKR